MGDIIVDFLNGAIQTVGDTVSNVIDSISKLCAFDSFQNVLDNELLSMLNWFIPISEMVLILESWGLSIAGWYAISVIARWAKLRS